MEAFFFISTGWSASGRPMPAPAAASRPPGLAAEREGTEPLVPQLTQRVVQKSPLRGWAAGRLGLLWGSDSSDLTDFTDNLDSSDNSDNSDNSEVTDAAEVSEASDLSEGSESSEGSEGYELSEGSVKSAGPQSLKPPLNAVRNCTKKARVFRNGKARAL